MPLPQKEALRPLTVVELTTLERLTEASRARVDAARRAGALLAVAAGWPQGGRLWRLPSRSASAAGVRSPPS